MVSWHTVVVLGAAGLLAAALACAAADSPAVGTPGNVVSESPVPVQRDVAPTRTVPLPATNAGPAVGVEQLGPDADLSPTAPASAAPTTPDGVAPPPEPSPGIRKDLTEAQHQDIDAQIAEMRKSPASLAECARESGDTVPAPGSAGEVDWYAVAAIKYAACAASKSTGVDWEGR